MPQNDTGKHKPNRSRTVPVAVHLVVLRHYHLVLPMNRRPRTTSSVSAVELLVLEPLNCYLKEQVCFNSFKLVRCGCVLHERETPNQYVLVYFLSSSGSLGGLNFSNIHYLLCIIYLNIYIYIFFFKHTPI